MHDDCANDFAYQGGQDQDFYLDNPTYRQLAYDPPCPHPDGQMEHIPMQKPKRQLYQTAEDEADEIYIDDGESDEMLEYFEEEEREHQFDFESI